MEGMTIHVMMSQIETPKIEATRIAVGQLAIARLNAAELRTAVTKRNDQNNATQKCMPSPTRAVPAPPVIAPFPSNTLATPLNTRAGEAYGAISIPVAEANNASLTATNNHVFTRDNPKLCCR